MQLLKVEIVVGDLEGSGIDGGVWLKVLEGDEKRESRPDREIKLHGEKSLQSLPILLLGDER
jgi:hypothetical protein